MQETPTSSPAFTVVEAAIYLRCARTHVFGLIHAGKLPFQRVGKRYIVPRRAVEELLAAGWRTRFDES